ncbi:hypothetical protein M758_UG080400 [Ceratodon purpureus]|nr:hypothetical protein M758_UG080400 [Ceratodon purpureus]
MRGIRDSQNSTPNCVLGPKTLPTLVEKALIHTVRHLESRQYCSNTCKTQTIQSTKVLGGSCCWGKTISKRFSNDDCQNSARKQLKSTSACGRVGAAVIQENNKARYFNTATTKRNVQGNDSRQGKRR